MKPTEFIWMNGQIIPWQDAKVHVLTHSLHYGSAAFEGIRFYKTERGPAIYRLDDHLKRMEYSANTLHMSLPYTWHEIRSAIIEVVKLNKLEQGYIRPIVYYGYSVLGVNPHGNPTEIAIACWDWPKYLADEVDIKTASLRRIHPAITVVDAKLSGNYLNGVLEALTLHGTHYREILFLGTHGFITEGAGENFFIVKDKQLYTPPPGMILKGLTRDTIFNICKREKIPVHEQEITLEEAYAADEAFFTGTAAEVMAIKSIDDQVIGRGHIGPITAFLRDTYLNVVHGKDKDFSSYLTYIE